MRKLGGGVICCCDLSETSLHKAQYIDIMCRLVQSVSQSKHRTSGKSKQFTAAMVVDFGVTKHVCQRTRGGGFRDFI